MVTCAEIPTRVSGLRSTSVGVKSQSILTRCPELQHQLIRNGAICMQKSQHNKLSELQQKPMTWEVGMSIGLVYLELLPSSLYLKLLPAWRLWDVNGTSTSNTTQAKRNKTTHLSRDSRNCKTSSRSAATASLIQWDDMQTARSSRTAMSWATTSWLASESSSGWQCCPCLSCGKITPRNEKSSQGLKSINLLKQFTSIYGKGTEIQKSILHTFPEWEFTAWSLLDPNKLGVSAFSAESLAASCASCKRLESSPASAECLSCTAVYCQSQSKTIWNYVAVKAGHCEVGHTRHTLCCGKGSWQVRQLAFWIILTWAFFSSCSFRSRPCWRIWRP